MSDLRFYEKLCPYDRSLVINKMKTDLQNFLDSWKNVDESLFTEAVGEVNQGNSCESYFLIKNAIGTCVYRFDDIPRSIVLSELLDCYQKSV
jgi:hypothetical protein